MPCSWYCSVLQDGWPLGVWAGNVYFQGKGRSFGQWRRTGFCEAEARCLLQHESYVAVKGRHGIEFVYGVEWKGLLLLSVLYHSKMWFSQDN